MTFRLLSLALAAALAALPQAAIAPDRKIALFNGKSLDGWYTWLKENRYNDPKQVFTVRDGQIRISGEEWGGLTTRQAFRDYHLTVEWRWGDKTWGAREKRARDSGILIHGVGEDGAYSGTWLESIESQIIEGGSGDIILVGARTRPRMTTTVREQGKEIYWDKNGKLVTRDSGRIDWWGRSPEWQDVLGFRGPQDVEKPAGEWNRQEIFADGDRLAFVLNGKLVNQGYNLSHRAGKIQIQSEGAGILIRRVEIEPIRSFPSALVLKPGVPVLVEDREPAALKKAAANLAADLGKVLGKPSRVVAAAPAAGPTIRVAVDRTIQGNEVLEIRAVPGGVLLTGSDLRGAIYAVYEFSQRFLGVDPMYFWTDHAPARKAEIRVPDNFIERQGSPTFRYRGWFINDEDLLTGWRPGTADGTGVALSVWDKIFETILRLKGNMVVPGTFIFPDEPQVKAAGERGLIVTQHHIEVVGTNTYRWPDNLPYSFSTRPELLVSAWTKAVEGYAPGQEVIWTVGYRGRHDRAFWRDDPSVGNTDADRARLIRAAIDKQVEIVRARKQQPYFLMNAWMEAVGLIRSGALRIPEGVTLVWPDNGHGVIEDGGTIAKGQGVYYHTAMHDFRANQLTERVPLERIRRELGRAARAGATEYLLINTSDVRPVPMTTRAAMELAWDAAPWNDAAYLKRWCVEEFGERAAAAVEEYYRAYFAAPGRFGPAEEDTLADTAYYTFARAFLVDEITGTETLPKRWVDTKKEYGEIRRALAAAAEQSDAEWTRVRALADKAAPLVPADRRDFFQSHVLTQVDFQRYANRVLIDVLAAVHSADREVKRKRAASAIENMQSCLRTLQASEYGQWKGFYTNDLFVAVRHAMRLAQAYQLKLEGKPIPPEVPIRLLPEDHYVTIKAYQGGRRVILLAIHWRCSCRKNRLKN